MKHNGMHHMKVTQHIIQIWQGGNCSIQAHTYDM